MVVSLVVMCRENEIGLDERDAADALTRRHRPVTGIIAKMITSRIAPCSGSLGMRTWPPWGDVFGDHLIGWPAATTDSFLFREIVFEISLMTTERTGGLS